MPSLTLTIGLALLATGVHSFEQPNSRLRKPVLPTAPPTTGGAHSTDLIAGKKPEPVESQTPGYLAVLGGMMIHLACGSMYCWGNLISYLPGSLKYWSPEGGTGPADASLVLAFILMSQMSGMPFGPVLESMIGPRFTAMIGAVMMGSGLWLASYAETLTQFVLSYAVLFGLGVGVAYQMPYIVGGRWFPSKRGTVQGAITSAMGASALVFNTVSTKLINPDGINPTGGVFPPEITARWSGLLRTLGTCYAALALVGAALQTNPASLGKKCTLPPPHMRTTPHRPTRCPTQCTHPLFSSGGNPHERRTSGRTREACASPRDGARLLTPFGVHPPPSPPRPLCTQIRSSSFSRRSASQRPFPPKAPRPRSTFHSRRPRLPLPRRPR